MPRLLTLLVLLLALLAAPARAQPSASDLDARVNAVADAYLEVHYDESPVAATIAGRSAHGRLRDNSLAAIARRGAVGDSLLAVLDGVDEARLQGMPTWTTLAILRQHLALQRGLRVCRNELWDVNQMWGWHTEHTQLAELQPVGTPELRRQSLARWAQFAAFVDEEIAKLEVGLASGYSAPQSVVDRVVAQVDGLIALGTEASPFFSPAARDGDPAFATATRRLVEGEIVPALARYRAYLAETYRPQAREALTVTANPDGAACYEASIRSWTSTDKSGAEVYALGRQTVDENARVVSELGERLYGVSDVAEVVRRAQADPADRLALADEVLAFSRDAMARAERVMPDWVLHMPPIEAAVVPFEPHMEGTGQSAHYRTGNDERPGEYRIPLDRPEDQSRGNLEITAFHEIWPGHHLQIATAQTIDGLHPAVGEIGFSGYVEGWGRYSEALAEEMGLYQTASAPILRRAWPARGMVVDPGIHLYGWTREEAKAFMAVAGRMPASQLDEMVDRIAILPGQLTAYDTGGLEIVALRREAEAALGDAFDVRAFHQEVLRNGSLPLLQLRVHVEAWIAEQGRTPTGAVGAPGPEAVVDSLMAEYAAPGSPGGVVAVIEGGQVAFARGYGDANLAYGLPNTPETVFNIGSVSKQFAGIFFAMLAEEGRLSLDDDVRDYLPELPDFGETVTLRHLLNHTSGYREVYGPLYLQGRRVDGDILDRQDAIRVVQRQPALQFTPGSRWLYNSTAYVLLTEIAERITDEPYPDWMEANVFGPLGMAATEIEREAGDVIPNAAVSYTRTERGTYRNDFEAYNYYGATDVYTTAGDLARWMQNLGASTLGGPGVMRRMTEKSVLPSGDSLGYTLGLFVDEHLGLRRLQHGGATGSYRTFLAYYPALDAGVVVMSNLGSVPVQSIAEATAAAAFGREDEAPAVVRVPSARLQAYAGTYRAEGFPVFTLATTGDTLTVSSGGPSAALRALDDSTFAIGRRTFQFSPATGRVTINDWGMGPVALDRTAPVPDGIDLGAYAGRYVSEEVEAMVTVSQADGSLVVEQTRLGPMPLRPVGRDVFAGDYPFIEVAFERDASGAVTGFAVSAGRSYGIAFRRDD